MRMGAKNMNSTKECLRCKDIKDLSEFYNVKYSWCQDGYDYYCKFCRIGTAIKSRSANKKKCSLTECSKPHYAKTYCRVHYSRLVRNGSLEPKTRIVSSDGAYYDNKGKLVQKKEEVLKARYKIDILEYNKKLVNGCEICGDKPERSLHIDHDHNCCNGRESCGVCVRGIVCNGCNKAVDKYEKGLMRSDNPKRDKVEEYLRKYARQ